MSGGVDSSVAALLLIEQGYQVEGLFMKNWDEDDGSEYCTAMADLADAQQVCDTLNIPLHTANFAADYWDNVFEHFLEEYRLGRTPNPDILCNREIKFKVFLDYAQLMGADYIATGHYTRVDNTSSGAKLLKGLDNNKDQSYFLYTLGQKQLSRTLFPLGELPKTEVRTIAEKASFITHDKKDSTGICFVGERHFREFLSRYIPAQPGEMRTPEGELVGRHNGLMYYTLGQRQGLGIGGRKDSTGEPWFVAGKDMQNKVLFVVQGDHPWLHSQNLTAQQVSWVAGQPPKFPFHAKAKTRYRQADQPCEVTQGDNGDVYVNFIQPQRAVTPGQSVVFYQGDNCLGGGIITQTDAPGIHP